MNQHDWRDVARDHGLLVGLPILEGSIQSMAEEIMILREIEKFHDDATTEFCEKITAMAEYSEKLRQTLISISKNSCCQPCREAGLWAKEALAIPRPGEAK